MISPQQAVSTEPRWSWPKILPDYDRTPALTPHEYEALVALEWQLRRGRIHDSQRAEWSVIQRLIQPLDEARSHLFTPPRQYHQRCSLDAVALILHACMTSGKSYWAWETAEWLHAFGPDQQTFQHRFGGWVDGAVRPYMVGIAYLLNLFPDFSLLVPMNRIALAQRIFGPERLNAAIEPIQQILSQWGYQSARHRNTFPGLICLLLLYNRSPYVTDLSTSLLHQFREQAPPHSNTGANLYAIQRALAEMGITDPPMRANAPLPLLVEGVDPHWLAWVERWAATSTLTNKVRSTFRTILFKVGRWLVQEHPHIQQPADWTRDLCASFLAMADRLCVGDYVQRQDGLGRRVGQPLSVSTKASYIVAMRTFLANCQEWEWMPRRFDPARALATPRSIRAAIGPNPRVIADAIWAKLLWAGLHLTPADLPMTAGGQFYPLALVQAITMTWLFGGLRSDEIARLRVGCIRWQQEPGKHVPAAGQQDPATIVCLLDIPVNKTGSAFTKPVDPLIGQAIEAWEHIRPTQPIMTDRRTGEQVHFLFCYRARRVAKEYINVGLIPALCQKAGVPTEDVRGRITSHRARATIASQLYNAKEPMTLFELQAWLGHQSVETTQHYARITPTTLAKAYADAGYFARNMRTIAVLIDRDAVENGAPTRGEPWQYFDLGHGYCTYSFFDQCPHRMACARCDFYVPKGSTQSQLLEAKAHLQHMLATIPLTEEERAAVEEGAMAVEELINRLADIPTPAGPTPRQLTGKLLPVLQE